MKLHQITFTGIGTDTDLKLLKEIQDEYPLAEWGVLISRNWKDNGNRFFDPSQLHKLAYKGLNLSCHLCGRVAKDAVNNNWQTLWDMLTGYFGVFQRCQLNVAPYNDNPEKLDISIPEDLNELIIQQKSPTELDLWCSGLPNPRLSVLLDASGGQGLDTPVRVLNTHLKVGYAGGINPDNVGEKLYYLMREPMARNIWIDMESGVRTNDVFDTDKVLKVLSICNEVLNDFKSKGNEAVNPNR